MDEKLLNARKLCLDQARSFITAAEQLDSAIWPHIVFHLSLLALEEVGKANLLAARAISGNRFEGGMIEKSLTSHRRKLQWAIWSPLMRIHPRDFENARDFAERAHGRRLRSLYVDPAADPMELSPAQQIPVADAESALELARARHAFEGGAARPMQVDELTEWFLDTASDEQTARRLFSGPFLAKYEELHGEPRAWAAWAKEEFDRLDAELRATMEREIARPGAPEGQSKPRWRANAAIYTPSHSLRSKALAHWNSNLEAVQLLWTGKKDQLTLQIVLNDDAPIGELTGRLASLAKVTVACLNIGTIGYFWFERPGFEQKMFKEIYDIELKMPLEMRGGESFWGDGRPVALTQQLVDHALHCMLAYAPLSEAAAEPIFRPYFDGLAFIAKSDVFYDLNELARESFVASLAGALRRYGDWDGRHDSFEDAFHAGFAPFMPQREHRGQMLKSLTRDGDPTDTSLGNLRSAKHLADLYLIHTARRTWRSTLETERGSLSE